MVEHHHIPNGEKVRLQAASYNLRSTKDRGLAGLYCDFFALSHAWMTQAGSPDGRFPVSLMDVNYGTAVKRCLWTKVRLLHIHRFDHRYVQFGHALVSSAVVWFIKVVPLDYDANQPSALCRAEGITHGFRKRFAGQPKWTCFPLAETRTNDSIPTWRISSQSSAAWRLAIIVIFILTTLDCRA